jgi:hypothetical protein
MKNLIIHGIYLSVIAVISFLFFNKIKLYDKALIKSNEALESDSNFFEKACQIALKEINKNIDADPKYAQYNTIANDAIKLASNTEIAVDNLIKKETISKDDIDSIKKMVSENRKKYLSLISKSDVKQLSESIPLNDSTKLFLNELSSNYLIMNELNIIKNKNNKSKLAILNYCLDKSSGKVVTRCGFGFNVAISPLKAVLIEGETMKAEIYKSEYETNNSNMTLEVNGKPLSMKGGVGIFQETPKTIGTHRILASLTIRNPFTGATATSKREFIYEVLPKCSRDCAKNQ